MTENIQMSSQENEQLLLEFQNALRRMKGIRSSMGPMGPVEGHGSCKEQKLKHGDGHLLREIVLASRENPSIRPADLAEKVHMSPQALSPMFKRLEGEGYIERRLSGSDRRVLYVEPTEKGKKLTKHISQTFDGQVTGLLQYLGEEDAKSLIGLINKTTDYFIEQGRKLSEKDS